MLKIPDEEYTQRLNRLQNLVREAELDNHGFGLSHHEGPFLAEGSHDTLAENMVISIEPGIYVDEVGGFRLGHDSNY